MRILAFAPTKFENSYNRKLLEFAKLLMMDIAEIEIVKSMDFPIFSPDSNINDYPDLLALATKIEEADGIIISTPEHNNSIPVELKSFLEWMAYEVHPFRHKPVMILGVSIGPLATARAQRHLRQILSAPGLEAFAMPGFDFLLANAEEKFDLDGRLVDEKTSDILEHGLMRFIKYAQLISKLDLDSIESTYSLTMLAGGYVNLDDPDADASSMPSEY